MRETESYRQTVRHLDNEKERVTTDRQTDRQTDNESERVIGRQSDR